MNNLQKAFSNGKAFVTYLMAGDPTIEKSAEYLLALQAGGADLIEIGIPFSDPIAEGEVIQRASQRALSAGATLDKIFAMLETLQGRLTVPAVFMTYLNPVFVYGYERFFSRCKQCGITGIIIPDLPYEEQAEVRLAAKPFGIATITLVAPTSEERIAKIANDAEGFIYLVSSMGVTGVRNTITTDVQAMTAKIKEHTQVPVAVGFGIATPAQAKQYSQLADGVIVGSAIVRQIEENTDDTAEKLTAYVRSIKNAIAQ